MSLFSCYWSSYKVHLVHQQEVLQDMWRQFCEICGTLAYEVKNMQMKLLTKENQMVE